MLWISCGYACGKNVDSVVLSGVGYSCYQAQIVRAIRRSDLWKGAWIVGLRRSSNKLTYYLTMIIGAPELGTLSGASRGRSACKP